MKKSSLVAKPTPPQQMELQAAVEAFKGYAGHEGNERADELARRGVPGSL